MDIRIKKTTIYEEQDKQKVEQFNEVIETYKKTGEYDILYTDETGFDKYLYRERG